MSDNEEIWLDPGHADPERAATALSEALGMRLVRRDDEWHVGTDRLWDNESVAFWGLLEANVDSQFPAESWPEDYSVFSDMPLVWTVESIGDENSTLLERAREAFDRMTTQLPWRIALTHGITELVATYDLERGVREFPPGTLADGRGRDRWA